MRKNLENDQNRELPEDLIIGCNSVTEALRSGREIDCVMVSKGEHPGAVGRIIAMCREKNIVVKDVDTKKLDFLCANANHQGIAAKAAAHSYYTIDDILRTAEERGEPPFLVICDSIEDSHNLGAIIRTCEACGAHGVIIPERRSASLNFVVAKTACGALEYVKVAKVGNLAQTIEKLKEKNIWIYGADMDGTLWCETDFSGGVALVIGSEGKGIGRLVREKCDFIVSLPMKGRINSLNASVAAGIVMYEVAKQRLGGK